VVWGTQWCGRFGWREAGGRATTAAAQSSVDGHGGDDAPATEAADEGAREVQRDAEKMMSRSIGAQGARR
jgi:hypothetical protein